MKYISYHSNDNLSKLKIQSDKNDDDEYLKISSDDN